MPNKKQISVFEIIIYGAIGVTLAATPMFNKDSLVIPKVALLFIIALYLLPYVINNYKSLTQHKLSFSLFVVAILILIQMALVLITTNSPFVQQLYGRTGRGTGLLTFLSLIILMLAANIFIKTEGLNKINFGLAIAGTFTAVYSIFQYYGLDFYGWDSKTNGIIATLGNPNFVSSFLAMALIPTLVVIRQKKQNLVFQLLVGLLFLFSLYIAESTQGYVTLFVALISYALIFFWFKKQYIFYLVSVFTLAISWVAVMGMLNIGPLSSFLYKISVQARGDFWRSAYDASKSNPIFGVGLDSFGDHYLKFRDEIAVGHPFTEYTDSAHNYFLDYAVSGGKPLALLHLLIIVLLSLSFYSIQKRKIFDAPLASLFSTQIVIYAQSIISPMNISIMVWGSVITGALIGASRINIDNLNNSAIKQNQSSFRISSLGAVILGIFIIFPYFNADRLQLTAMNTGNGDLAIKSTKMYPESVVRYSTMSRALLDSGLSVQALDLAYSAVRFNPNSPALWSLILINPSAPIEQRKNAQTEILKLDPLNKEVINYFN